MNQNKLDNVIYGQENVKTHILEIISQYFSNQNCSGNIFGIYGPMGVGKTTIIKDGLSKVMNKPFNFISLGGAQDSAFLDGHSYTYEGSTYGKIVECLIKSKCMNPIIYFDELDKISNTPKGEEIINLLIHITDDTQNCNFQDKYFSGININLSKCIFVFSFNDPNKINNILKDRIQLIKVDGFNSKDKIKIANDFLIPKILNEYNINDIRIKSVALSYFVEKYSNEDGVRELKHILKKLISKINLIKYSNNDLMNYKINLKFPLNISLPLIKNLDFKYLKKGIYFIYLVMLMLIGFGLFISAYCLYQNKNNVMMNIAKAGIKLEDIYLNFKGISLSYLVPDHNNLTLINQYNKYYLDRYVSNLSHNDNYNVNNNNYFVILKYDIKRKLYVMLKTVLHLVILN